jgi:tetratricopeptide (TPR) repeat protein
MSDDRTVDVDRAIALLKQAMEDHAAGLWTQAETNLAEVIEIVAYVPGLEILEASARIGWARAVAQTGRTQPEALPNAERAVELCEQHMPDHLHIALTRLGAVLREYGRVPEAIVVFNRAVEVSPEQDRPTPLLELARAYLRERDPDAARGVYDEVIRIAGPESEAAAHVHQRIAGELDIADRDEEARVHRLEALRLFELHDNPIEVARSLYGLKRYDEALAQIEGLEGVEQVRFAILSNRAYDDETAGRLDAAREGFREASNLMAEVQPVSNAYVRSLVSLASVEQRLGEREGVIDHLETALGMAERFRALEHGDRAQLQLFGEMQDAYQDLIEALFERAAAGDHERAFEVHELSRARGLVEQMLERRAARGTSDRFAAQERDLRSRLGDPTIDRRAVERELELLDALRAREVGEAAVEPIDLAAAQEWLDASTLVLAFDASGDATFVWAVRHDAFAMGRLDATGDRLAELVDQAVGDYQRDEPAGARAAPARRELARILLGAVPARAWDGARRLLVIPDGRLHQLPFELLRQGDAYLGDSYPIAYAPSLTTIVAVTAVERPGMFGTEFVGFGDPAYALEQDGAATTRSGVTLTRLEGSGEEVRAIARELGRDAGGTVDPDAWARHDVYLRRLATEDRARARVPLARFVHFATHTVIDDKDPLYSGLALAPPSADELLRDEHLDDMLQAQELLGMELSADVVVCSACATGLGRLHDGEGLVGFTRAFLLAGARCVVVSLWPVDDDATAFLMGRVYAHLRDNQGAAEALRRARIDTRDDLEGWRDPRDWAAFVAVGDAW